MASSLLLVAVLENTILPWAPFYVIYAALTTAVPLLLGSYEFARLRSLKVTTWIVILASPVLLQLLALFLLDVLYPLILGAVGVDAAAAQGPTYQFDAAFELLFSEAGRMWGAPPKTLQGIYLIFILGWAGLGEELFYRGYMHGELRRHHSFAAAMLISAGFFGIRHATQFGLLWPSYPWGAALAWSVFSFVAGAFMSYLYEKTGSLYPPVIAHYLLNAIPFIAAAVDPS